MQRSAFFCKRMKCSWVLFVLCKRTLRSLRSLRSFPFLRKEQKRTHRAFGFHKSPKTQKKTEKNVAFFKRTVKNGKERNVQNGRGAQPWLRLEHCSWCRCRDFLIILAEPDSVPFFCHHIALGLVAFPCCKF